MRSRRSFLGTFIVGTTLTMFCLGVDSHADEPRSTTDKDEISIPRKSSIVGTWLFNVDTGIDGLAPLQAFVTFNRGGTLIVSQNTVHENSAALDFVCRCNASNAHGVWVRTGRNTFSFKFSAFIFAGPDTADLSLNFSEPVLEVGQHIGFGRLLDGSVEVRGDKLKGTNIGAAVNLDGENINPEFLPVKQSFRGERMKIARVRD